MRPLLLLLLAKGLVSQTGRSCGLHPESTWMTPSLVTGQVSPEHSPASSPGTHGTPFTYANGLDLWRDPISGSASEYPAT